jgi:hypothetical protein
MLRIFRGERRAQNVAQPGQHEQDADAQAGQQGPAGDTPIPPQSTGGGSSDLQTQTATTPAEPVSTPAPVPGPQQSPTEQEPGFLDRGRMRRRARFLRVARELAYRDLGGLVFDLHRFARRNDEIVAAKLNTLSRIDSELRALESALRERRPVAVLREAGVAACPRCAAIHGSGDRFCPTCGLSVDQAERPIAAPPAPAAGPSPPPSSAGWPPPAPAPLQAWPGVPAVHPPAVQPAAASAAPPIPQPFAEPVPTSAASGRPAAVPAPARTRPRATTAPAPTDTGADNGQQSVPASSGQAADAPQSRDPDASHVSRPAAPTAAGRVPEATDQPTEVIRSGLRGGIGQQTVAFDPIAPSRDGAESEKDDERRQDRP